MSPGQPYAINADVSALGVTAKLIGGVADPFGGRGLDFTIALDGPDLGTIGALLDVALPSKPYHLSGKLSGDIDKVVAISGLKASLGGSALSGDGSVVVNAPRPKINATINATMLDLTEWPKANATASAC